MKSDSYVESWKLYRGVPAVTNARRFGWTGRSGALIWRQVTLVVSVVGLSLGCQQGSKAPPSSCRFLKEEAVRRSVHLAYDGIALAALDGDRALAVWSEPSGWFAQAIDATGRPSRSAPVLLGERCRGGVAVAADRAGIELLCVRPERPLGEQERVQASGALSQARADEAHAVQADAVVHAVESATTKVQETLDPLEKGEVSADAANVVSASEVPRAVSESGALLWRSASLDLRKLSEPQSLTSLGSLSAGLAATLVEGELWVALLNADPDVQEVLVAHVPQRERGQETLSIKHVSRAGHAAGAPTLLARPDGGPPWVAFAEVFLERGQVQAELRLAVGQERADLIMPVRSRDAAPQLAWAFGRVHMVYRDRPGDAPPGLFAVSLGSKGRPDRQAVRLARADGDASPALAQCEQALLTAIPRVYAGDYFIGVNHLDAGLERIVPEQQFYEDRHAFFQVASACVRDQALLLVAERARPGQQGAVLRTVPVTCRAERQDGRNPTGSGHLGGRVGGRGSPLPVGGPLADSHAPE